MNGILWITSIKMVSQPGGFCQLLYTSILQFSSTVQVRRNSGIPFRLKYQLHLRSCRAIMGLITGTEAQRCNGNRQALALHKGMGSKSPHLTNTVGIENHACWRKPVIGET